MMAKPQLSENDKRWIGIYLVVLLAFVMTIFLSCLGAQKYIQTIIAPFHEGFHGLVCIFIGGQANSVYSFPVGNSPQSIGTTNCSKIDLRACDSEEMNLTYIIEENITDDCTKKLEEAGFARVYLTSTAPYIAYLLIFIFIIGILIIESYVPKNKPSIKYFRGALIVLILLILIALITDYLQIFSDSADTKGILGHIAYFTKSTLVWPMILFGIPFMLVPALLIIIPLVFMINTVYRIYQDAKK